MWKPLNAPALFVCLLGASGGDSLFAQEGSSNAPRPFDVEEARPVVVENAILKLIDDVSVPAEVSGTVESMAVREGDRVVAGQVLASIRSDAVQMDLKKAEIELTTAKYKADNEIDIHEAEKTAAVSLAELERVLDANKRVSNSFLESEVERYRLIYERSALGVERAKYEQKLARANMELARHALVMQHEVLNRYTIAAPLAGIAVSVTPKKGEWVEAGTVVAQIVDVSRLRLEGFVHIGVAGFDLEQTEAVVNLALQERRETTRGVVTFVSPEVNPVNSMVRVFIEIDNAELLFRPGLKVEANLVLRDRGTGAVAPEDGEFP